MYGCVLKVTTTFRDFIIPHGSLSPKYIWAVYRESYRLGTSSVVATGRGAPWYLTSLSDSHTFTLLESQQSCENDWSDVNGGVTY